MTTASLPLLVSLYTHKGGVGKTADVHNLVYVLATELRLKVMVADLDPQASLTGLVMHDYFLKKGSDDLKSKGLNITKIPVRDKVVLGEELYYNEKRSKRQTIYELLKDGEEEKKEEESKNAEVIVHEELTIEEFDVDINNPSNLEEAKTTEKEDNEKYNLDYIIKNFNKVKDQVEPLRVCIDEDINFLFIPGDLNLIIIEGEITEALALSESSTKFSSVFKNMPGVICKLLREVGRREKVDIILLDLNPGASGFNMACIMGSDYFIVPNLPDFHSRRSISSLAKLLERWDKSCERFRKGGKFSLPACPKFLGQIINQVEIRNRDPTQDKENMINLLQKEIQNKLVQYMALGAVFLKDPPIITYFTRLVHKVDEIGVPISRATYKQIFPHRTRKNMTQEEVNREVKLHLNCYFAAAISIFSNLSNPHHRLLRNILRLDITRILPQENSILPTNEIREIKGPHEIIWVRDDELTGTLLQALNPRPTIRDIAETLNKNIAGANLVNDIYSAFSLARKENLKEVKGLDFEELQDAFNKAMETLNTIIVSLKKYSVNLGLKKNNFPQDPQLCKISYCSDIKEDKTSKNENTDETKISETIDAYFDAYIKVRIAAAKMSNYLAEGATKEKYIELIKKHERLLGESSLKVYAHANDIKLQIWVQDDQLKKPIILSITHPKNDGNTVNILCETKGHEKIFTKLRIKPVKQTKKGAKPNDPKEVVLTTKGKKVLPTNHNGMQTRKILKK